MKYMSIQTIFSYWEKLQAIYQAICETKGAYLFDILFRGLLFILPFHVILSVFLEHKIGITGFTLYKEGILIGMVVILLIQIFTKKLIVKLDIIDYMGIAYVLWLIIVTFFYSAPFSHLVYGGRYDFEFLFAFFLIKHGYPLLRHRPMRYFKDFILSGGIALVVGILVRWIFWESILLYFGFSGNLSNWNFGGSIPIYHGIDGANVRRFQWIFDGPNPAGFFILLYLWVLASYFRSAKKYYYLLSLFAFVLLVALFYTYSRSSVIWLVWGIGAILLFQLSFLWKKHRILLLSILPVLLLTSGLFYLKFENTIHQILLREGSTKGHFDRSVIGLKRFMAAPLGSGLATAGPAYRFVTQPEENKSLFEGENKLREDYYIPESWFIQQLIEWGFVGFLLFVGMLGIMARGLVEKNIFLFGSFVAMAIMNLFLHSYESVYISLLLFMFVSLTLYYDIPRTPQRTR